MRKFNFKIFAITAIPIFLTILNCKDTIVFSDFTNANDSADLIRPDKEPLEYNFDQQNLTLTNRESDLAISGDGLLVLKKDNQFVYYRRPGKFFRDNEGFFLLSFNSLRLQGIPVVQSQYEFNEEIFKSINNGSTPVNMTDIKIPNNLIINGKVTTEIYLSGNLSSTKFGKEKDPAIHSASVFIYDNSENIHQLIIQFFPAENLGQWILELSSFGNGFFLGGNTGILDFKNIGTKPVLIFESNSNTFSFVPSNGSKKMDIKIDVDGSNILPGLTQVQSPSTAYVSYQNGHGSSTLTGLVIDKNGHINGKFSNNLVVPLFRIVLANFSTLEGLDLLGDNHFTQTIYSGEPVYYFPDESSKSIILQGVLEDN